MKTYLKPLYAIVIITILFIMQLNCRRPFQKTPAYQRWGITKPLTDQLTEPEFVSAYNLLYGLKFEDAKNFYKELGEKYPNSAEAHLGLSISYRYLHKLSEAVAECQKALELDPDAIGVQLNYADLLSPFRGAAFKEPLSDSARYALSINYYKKALKTKHPLNKYANLGLWNNYFIGLGQLPLARQQMIILGKKKYFPTTLKDFAYNILINVEPNAIIFTNGDNDTYPLFYLQDCENVRRDVSIVNINLLNIPHIAMLMRDSLNVPISFTDKELLEMRPKKDRRGFWIYAADNLIANIVENS